MDVHRVVRLAQIYGKELNSAFYAVRAGLVDDVEDLRGWVKAFAPKAIATLQDQVEEALEDTLTTERADEVSEAFAHAYEVLVEPVNSGEDWAIRSALKLAGEDSKSIPKEMWQRMAIMALRATNSLSFDPHRNSKQPSAPTATTKAQPSSGLSAIASQLASISAKVEAQGKAKDDKTFGASLHLYAKIKAEMRNEPIADIKADDLFRVPDRFGQFIGLHKKLDEVKTEDVIRWLDAQQDQRSKKETKELGTGTRNRNRFVGSLSTFFDVAVARGWALQNPAKGLRKSRRTKPHERRAAFTNGDLHKLFTPELRAEAGRGFPERWWVPCLMLLNGTRTNEVCQLHLLDIVDIGGVACLRILPEDATQSTMTEESDRIVPLHPQLIELGFLDYIAARRAATGGDPNAQVFPNLTFRKRFGYKTKLVNYFAGAKGHLQRIGIREDMKKTLYSLRHTSITAMERAGVRDLARTQLTGHARQGDQGRLTYISDRDAQELLQELRKVDWQEAMRGLQS